MHVIKGGVLAFKNDEEKIRKVCSVKLNIFQFYFIKKLYEENQKEIEERQKEKDRREVLTSWRKVTTLIIFYLNS